MDDIPVRTLDAWRDIAWFDEAMHRVALTGRGEVWFVGGNSRGLLEEVAERSRDAGCLVAGPTPRIHSEEVPSILGGLAGAAAGLWHPVAELVVLLGAGALAARQRPKEDDRDLFGILDELVAAAPGTVVLVVDPSRWDAWYRLIGQITARRGRLNRQRIIVIVGLQDAPSDLGGVGAAHSALFRDAAALVRERKARWHWVPPLTSDLLKELLPLHEDVAHLLVTVSGGDDLLAKRRWKRWVDDRVVDFVDGAYCFIGDATDAVLVGVERTLNRLFGPDRHRIDRVYECLTLASLIGEEFCCETVVYSMSETTLLHESLADDLDALLDAEIAPPLLASVGCERNWPGRQPEYLWRYRFGDSAVATLFRGTLHAGEAHAHMVRLLPNLVRLRAHLGGFDEAIARLAREIGDTQTAGVAEARIAWSQELSEREIDVAVLVPLAARWESSDPYLCHQLIALTERMYRTGLATSAVEVGQAVVALARRQGLSELTVGDAHYQLGVAYRVSRDLDEAVKHLSIAAALHRKIVSGNLSRLNVTLTALGEAQSEDGHVVEGIRTLTEALAVGRRLARSGSAQSSQALASTLSALARARIVDAPAQAVEHLKEARLHQERLTKEGYSEALRDLVITLERLGIAFRRMGDDESASQALGESARHIRAIYEEHPTLAHRHDLAVSLYELGAFERECDGKIDQAIEHLSEAVDHRRFLYREEETPGHRRDLALTLYEFGMALRSQSSATEAIPALLESAELDREVYRTDRTMSSCHHLVFVLGDLASTYRAEGQSRDSIQLYIEAIEAITNMPGGPATPEDMNMLGHLTEELAQARREANE